MEASEQNTKMKNDSEKLKWKFFLRQLLICSGVWTCYFILGLYYGSATVMVPQLRREANSTEAVTEEIASWLPAIPIYSGLPWTFILSVMITYTGRKIPLTLTCVLTLSSFIVFFCSETITHIIISAILQGALTAAFFTIAVVVVTEYTSAKYRGIFLAIKSASFFWGVLAANTIGTFLHWKTIALPGIVGSVYSLATIFFWPESPYWLAAKGRFEDCSAAHRWLKGSDIDSERELEKIISSEQSSTRVKTRNCSETISEFFRIIICKKFYKPILLCVLVLCLKMFTGKLVCTVYALEIMKKITDSESTAYKAMLILDGVTVFSMYVGCGFAKLFKRRTILFTTTSLGIGFLFSMSLYLFLINLSLITENKYLSVILLSGYSISISCGPMIMASSISAELLPLHARTVSICVIAVISKIMNGSLMKISPYIFKGLGLHGTFLFYGLSLVTFLTLAYLYVPETKDKTLQEISDSVMGRDDNVADGNELMPLRGRGAKISIVPAKKNNCT